MKVKVTGATDKAYWYAHHVGREFYVKYLDSVSQEYIVRDCEGYLNVIKEKDCEVVKDDF